MEESNNDYEPMDVDLSGNSVKGMDISEESVLDDLKTEVKTPSPIDSTPVNSSHSNKAPYVKKYHINIQNKRNGRHSYYSQVLLFFFVLFISLVTYKIISFKCINELNFDSNKFNELSKEVFGQGKAMRDMVNALQIESNSKILFVYGGTGVGKTYSISLLFENLWDSANIYHFTMPSFVDSFSVDSMLGLIMCETSVIIVDDLGRNDIENIKMHVNSIILKSNNLKKNVAIVLVYNCDHVTNEFIKKCDDTFYSGLKDSFIDIDVPKYFIKFNTLNEEHLRQCIERELGPRHMNDGNINNIVKNFDVEMDGCKGVHTKIKSFKLT